MRAYNYVVVLTHDFDRIQYRLRAIDFDQQSFEGNVKVYKPQYLKENNTFVEMSLELPDFNDNLLWFNTYLNISNTVTLIYKHGTNLQKEFLMVK